MSVPKQRSRIRQNSVPRMPSSWPSARYGSEVLATSATENSSCRPERANACDAGTPVASRSRCYARGNRYLLERLRCSGNAANRTLARAGSHLRGVCARQYCARNYYRPARAISRDVACGSLFPRAKTRLSAPNCLARVQRRGDC